MKPFPILVIGDTHCPCMLKTYPDFLKKVNDKYKCKTVVHIGDLIDNHRSSKNHIPEAGWYDAKTERLLAVKQIRELSKRFPKLYLCLGNHDLRLRDLANSVGIDDEAIKDIQNLYEIPKTWIVGDEFFIGGIQFEHGTGTGNTPHLTAAMQNRVSTVVGHHHSVGGVEHIVGPQDRLIGVATGCGIDRHQLVFKYGQKCKKKPFIGCAVIFSDHEALSVPMNLGSKITRK